MKFMGYKNSKPKIFTKITAIAVIQVLVVLSLSGCYFFPKEEEVLSVDLIKPEKAVYNTITVKKGTIENNLDDFATFEPVNQYSLSFINRGGYLSKIIAQEGDMVKKGQVLAELDTESLKSQISTKNFDLQAAQQLYGNEKTSSNLDIKSAKLDLDEANRKYKETSGKSKDIVESAKIGVKKCEIALTKVKSSSKLSIDTAERNLNKIKIEMNDLKSELSKSRIISPISGIVDSVGDVKVGDMVQAKQTIFTVSDSSKLHLNYTGEKYSSFKLGMSVTANIEGISYKGKVVMTPYEAPTKEYEKLKNTVLINVKNQPKTVSIGDSAEIIVTLVKKEDVIVLPQNVVKDFQGQKYVKVLKNGIPVEKYIEIGISSDSEFEVIKGLQVGDKVIDE